MKKLFAVMAVLFVAITLAACGEEEGKFDVEDGQYFAIADEFDNGYKYWTVVTVEDKKITDVEWNAYHQDGGAAKCAGDDKYTCSEDGVYAMNGEKGDWYEQADKTTDWIVDNQKIDLSFDGGKTDEISSVSITTETLFNLVEEALDSDPVDDGDYTDGYYYLETELDEKTVTYARPVSDGSDEYETFDETFDTSTFLTVVVVNGTIVVADYNARHDAYEYVMDGDSFVTYAYDTDENDESITANVVAGTFGDDGFVPTKKYVTKDAAGTWYGISQTGKVEWDVQVQYIEEELLDSQSLSITDGELDDVAEATIHVNAFVSLYNDLMDEIE